MRVLLTGGAGFIGSHVADHLLARGHEVAVVDDLARGRRENLPEGARFYELDVRSGCREVFEDFAPEAVSHQAAQISVRRSVREPAFDADVNVIGTIRLLENCVEYGVGKVLFASSGGTVYGEQQQFPAPEDHPQLPISPYGVSKLAGEHYLHFFSVQHGLTCISLRYVNVYGPRQDPHGEAGVVAIFSRNLAAGDTSTINGSGDQTRDYAYVGDVARANLLALEGDAPSGSYNIGTGIETSVNEIYETLRELAGKDMPPRHGPAKPGEQMRSSVDPAKADRLLGWRPEVDLASGLQKTLKFFTAQVEEEMSATGPR
jgi:UDP-glucose 4-epimerase